MKQKDVISVRLAEVQPDNQNLIAVYVETKDGFQIHNLQIHYPIEL